MRTPFAVAAVAMLVIGCSDVAGPEPLALQFRGGVASIGLPPMSVSEEPRGFVRVTGGFFDGACGPIGATAVRRGLTVRLEIGPRSSSGCDLIRLGYEYEATLVGLAPGSYTVKVFHRPGAGALELAITAQVTVR